MTGETTTRDMSTRRHVIPIRSPSRCSHLLRREPDSREFTRSATPATSGLPRLRRKRRVRGDVLTDSRSGIEAAPLRRRTLGSTRRPSFRARRDRLRRMERGQDERVPRIRPRNHRGGPSAERRAVIHTLRSGRSSVGRRSSRLSIDWSGEERACVLGTSRLSWLCPIDFSDDALAPDSAAPAAWRNGCRVPGSSFRPISRS